jgi:hypothetical protein
MKMNQSIKTTMSLAAAMGGLALTAGMANAALSITSSGFSGTSLAVDTTGTSDWGYAPSGQFPTPLYSDLAYSASGVSGNAVVSDSSTIGAVTVSNNSVASKTANAVIFTFDGNNAIGAFGNLQSGEQDAWDITFNDLTVGTNVITLYLGHNKGDRVYDFDVFLNGVADITDTSARLDTYSTGAYAVKYEITVEATTATDDLRLLFGSPNGGSGEGYFAGYTVAAVPEPTTTALLGLGGLALILRRRK